MKIFTKQLLCYILCILLIASPSIIVEAAEGAMNISWKGNYSDTTELVITFKSKAPYTQQVSAVMYETSVDEPSFDDYRRMIEVKSLNGTESTFSIKLGNDLTDINGKYKITLSGNGYMASECTETVTVTVLTPDKKDAALISINGSNTETSLANELIKVEDALKLDLPDDEASLNTLMSEIIKVRKSSDYNGHFTVLNDVCDAYSKADVIHYLKSDTVTDGGLCQKVEENATLFGFDKADTDYQANKNEIYNKVISLKQSYKDVGITTWQQLIQAIEETTCVEIINNCGTDTISEAVSKYKSLIGMSDASYTTYLSFSETKADKVMRQLYQKSFTTIEEIKTAFENGVAVENESRPQNNNNNSDNSSDNGITIEGGNTVKPTPQTQDKFSDIKDNHWAYSYVENLNSTGIISGYPDGTFKPENTVTREEFIKMVISAAGLYDSAAECSFDDVASNAWYYRYVASAKSVGAISGITETAFGSGRNITRQDVAVIVARLLDRFKESNSSAKTGVVTSYADDVNVSDYAKASVNILTNLGIIDGFEDNSFNPLAYLTRAQAAKIIYMFRENI